MNQNLGKVWTKGQEKKKKESGILHICNFSVPKIQICSTKIYIFTAKMCNFFPSWQYYYQQEIGVCFDFLVQKTIFSTITMLCLRLSTLAMEANPDFTKFRLLLSRILVSTRTSLRSELSDGRSGPSRDPQYELYWTQLNPVNFSHRYQWQLS